MIHKISRKKTFFQLGLCIFFTFQSSFTIAQTIEELEIKRQVTPKPLAILFSTDWCSVCQIQKKELNKESASFFTENTYFIIINPEKYKKEISFLGKKYHYISNGSSGLHSFAYELMGKKTPSYPYWVFIDKNNSISAHTGFLNGEQLKNIIQNIDKK